MGIGRVNLGNVSITHYSKCNCGAITLYFDNGASNSMFLGTFEKLGIDLSDAEELPETYVCNHCVNHWGIDLCECGSGERVGECECSSDKGHDTLGVKFDSFAVVLDSFYGSIYG